MSNSILEHRSDRKAYIITGPTSGIGRATAFELAKRGTVVLVGRDTERLAEVQGIIERTGGHAVSVVCDLSDIANVRRAAADIIALNLPVAGLLNNAGIFPVQATKNVLGWDMTFATNHVGPFALIEALAPHLPDGANIVFVASAAEDPEHKPAKAVGFRGARYISVAASTRGEWKPGGSKQPGVDAYATSKLCALATALAFARETPRLHFNAVEPGVNPTTGLGREANASIRFLSRYIIPLLTPFIKVLSTPQQAARMITKVLIRRNRIQEEDGRRATYLAVGTRHQHEEGTDPGDARLRASNRGDVPASNAVRHAAPGSKARLQFRQGAVNVRLESASSGIGDY